MSMLENLPTVEEMMLALSSPVSPSTSFRDDDIELSTEDMIREMFKMMTVHGNTVNVGTGSGMRARDSSYDSSTDTYDGLPTTSQYNGNGV
jgi:hypothetical protein